VDDNDRKLGMDRNITRRQFVDGASKAIAGAALASSVGSLMPESVNAVEPGAAAGYYPPAWQGLRGQTDAARLVAHGVRDGERFPDGTDTGETYDLIVVGAGNSGLAAAYFYRKALPNAKILILDTCDDFGGHSRRNEFDVAGTRLIGFGGTGSVMFPGTYTPEGKALLADIGINAERYYKSAARDQSRAEKYDFKAGMFFDEATYGRDALVGDAPLVMPWEPHLPPSPSWPAFLARAPLSPMARKNILRLTTERRDYMPGVTVAEKVRRLRAMSYADYLTGIVGVGPETVGFITPHTVAILNVGSGPDSFSAWMAYRSYLPGFLGMGLPSYQSSSVVCESEMGEDIYFPDGNAGIARLLVRWLIPDALPGKTMEDSILTRVDYSALDMPGNAARIRLQSTVVRVKHDGEPRASDSVTVSYVQQGTVFRARAGTCVMACFNAIIPYLCPEMPASQREAQKLAVRKPLMMATVALHNWRAFAKLGVNVIYSSGCFYPLTMLNSGNSLGNNYAAMTPNDPTTVNMVCAPGLPGLSARDQYRAGRAQLQGMDFETHERNVRTQLQRMLGSGGFDAARDISGITLNRWAHGYACGANDLYDPPTAPDEAPCVRARQRFGRIAIANSDAAGISMTQAAIDQANRAVRELISDVIRPDFYIRNPSRG
jgi:spermidine dehydrogenase